MAGFPGVETHQFMLAAVALSCLTNKLSMLDNMAANGSVVEMGTRIVAYDMVLNPPQGL